MMAILKVKDAEGNIIEIPAMQGPPGKDGADYVLTDADKQEIASMVDVDGVIYLPTSSVTYESLKAYIDNGQDVVLHENDLYYNLYSYNDDAIHFSGFDGYVFTIKAYFNGAEDHSDFSWSTLTYDDVDDYYDPSSGRPVSGVGVAAALASFGDGGSGAVLLEAYSTTHAEINALIQEGKQVILWENKNGEIHYYHLTSSYDEQMHTFTCCVGSYVYSLSYSTLTDEPSYQENLNIQQSMVMSNHNPDNPLPVNAQAVEEALEQSVGNIETALDAIIAIQNELVGGDVE